MISKYINDANVAGRATQSQYLCVVLEARTEMKQFPFLDTPYIYQQHNAIRFFDSDQYRSSLSLAPPNPRTNPRAEGSP